MIVMDVELPLQQVVGRLDPQIIGEDGRLAMRRRAQLNGLRPERDQSIVSIFRPVMKFNPNTPLPPKR
jgi:hypothetical protein